MSGELFTRPYEVGDFVETKYAHIDLRPPVFSGRVIRVESAEYVLVQPHVLVREGNQTFIQISLHQGRLAPMQIGVRTTIPSVSEIEKRVNNQ